MNGGSEYMAEGFLELSQAGAFEFVVFRKFSEQFSELAGVTNFKVTWAQSDALYSQREHGKRGAICRVICNTLYVSQLVSTTTTAEIAHPMLQREL